MEDKALLSFLNQEKFAPIIRVLEDGRQTKLVFLSFEQKGIARYHELMAELWEGLTRARKKIASLSLQLQDSSGHPFSFALGELDFDKVSVARNGTISLYLTEREVGDLIRISGQRDNSRQSSRIAIYCFYPQAPEPKDNRTIFFVKDLDSCLIEEE